MIIKSPGNLAGERAKNSHGGQGEYFVRTLLTCEFSSSLKYMREIILEPGSSIGVHRHENDEEIYYIIAGKGIMTVDDETREIGCGDIVLTKSGSSHGLFNNSSGKLKFFVACAAL
ncbi:MAG: hypothetical protein A2096_17670 [Spirochaetes bacterium GWF1_41_5]|nr:MAG: hypothetical protein A2096_17670 [Spirochaetes bacterium GWF1_41_5]HBE02370.1 cupin domain-containing protein [Spirochaetia bacterium]